MVPRPTWKGFLKLSLVTFGVRLYNATTGAGGKVSFNQLHKGCGQRLKQKLVCPAHGEVERSDIAKGYEHEEGRYVVVEQSELDALEAKASKTIEITQFCDPEELQPIYMDRSYYIAPDGPIAEDGFRIIHAAIKKSGKIGIGRFVIHGGEHIVALAPAGRGLTLTTLLAADEVRSAEPYFEDLKEGPIDNSQLKLAESLISSITAPLDTSEFKDQYQEALRELIEAKIKGTVPAESYESEPVATFNFMEALQQSIKEVKGRGDKTATKKKPMAKSVAAPAAAAKKKRKKA
jgi:DNA end-binding protein Ku